MITLHLTLGTSSTATENVTACSSYTWHGTTYTTSGTHTFSSTNGSGCTLVTTLNLTITQPSSSSTTVTVCSSSLPYSWNGNSYSSAGTYSVVLTNAAGCDSTATLILNVSSFSVSASIGGPTAICSYTGSTGGNATYSVTAVAASGYVWTVPAGATLVSGQGSSSILVHFATTFAGGNISVVVSSACGSPISRSITLGKPAKPASPVAIIGATNACAYIGTSTPVTYSIAPVADALSYLWTLPSNTVLVGGSLNSTSVTITFTSGFQGGTLAQRTIGVIAISGCGNSAAKTLAIANAIPATPKAVVGPTNPCPYMDGAVATYYVNKVANATSYSWSVPAVGATIVSHPNGSGVNDTVITVAFDPSLPTILSSTDVISCAAISPCGNGIAKTLSLKRGALKGPAFAGTFLLDVCQYMIGTSNSAGTPVTYKIYKVAGATSYSWTLSSSGATIIDHPAGSGENDTAITVLFDISFPSTGATITVNGQNGCGAGPNTVSKPIKPVMSATPGTISGPVDACTSIATGAAYTYTIRKVPTATSYSWAAVNSTAGAAGSAVITGHPALTASGDASLDTSITVVFSGAFTGGYISVSSVRNCGVSVAKTLAVSTKKIALPTTFAITGATVVCPGQTVTYSCTAVANANSYTWVAPATATITGGQGTTTVSITYGSVLPAAVGKVGVTPSSLCGGGAQKTISVSKGACRVADVTARVQTATGLVTTTTGNNLDVSIYPNPSRGNFNIAINSSDKVNAAQVEIVNEYGQVVYSRTASNNNGVVELKVNNNLTNGIYMVTCTVDGQKVTKRLVINR